MIVREVLAQGGAILSEAGVENASLDASLLLAEVLNLSRSSLIASGPDPLAEDHLAAFHDFVKRRLAGECTAYILGRKEFYGLEFSVNPSVLVPRPETETLVETTVKVVSDQRLVNSKSLRVLDLCTGSGAVAIALKHEMPELEVWATDISAAALEIAKSNADRLLSGGTVNFCQGDLFDAFLGCGSGIGDQGSGVEVRKQGELPTHSDYKQQPPVPLFRIIVSNPPYIPTAEIAELSPEVRGEPLVALDGGGDGLDIIRRIITGAREFLCPGGMLLMEADPRQMKRIKVLFEKNGFIDINTYTDLSGKERVIGGQFYSS